MDFLLCSIFGLDITIIQLWIVQYRSNLVQNFITSLALSMEHPDF